MAVTEEAEYVELISSLLTQSWLLMVAIALLAYEYLITLHQEVALFWMRKKTGATWLYLGTRYMALLTYVFLYNASFASMSLESCSRLAKVQYLADICQYPFWAAFSGLRTLALSHMNYPLAVTTFLLGCAPFAVNMWGVASFDIRGIIYPIIGCDGLDSATAYEAELGTAISRSCVIASDILVLVVTLRYMAKNGGLLRRGRSSSNVAPSLTNVLIVNGLTYVLVLVAMNVLHIILTLLSIVNQVDSTSYVTIFTDPLSAILICRFLMDLQSANEKAVNPELSDIMASMDGADGPGTLHFATMVIGSIGGQITVGGNASLHDSYEGDESDRPVGDIVIGGA